VTILWRRGGSLIYGVGVGLLSMVMDFYKLKVCSLYTFLPSEAVFHTLPHC